MGIFKSQLQEIELLDSFTDKYTANSFSSINKLHSSDFSKSFRGSSTFGQTLSGERWNPVDGVSYACDRIQEQMANSPYHSLTPAYPLVCLSDSFIYYNDTNRPVCVTLCLSFWYNKGNKYGYVTSQSDTEGLHYCPYKIYGIDYTSDWTNDPYLFFEKGAELLLFEKDGNANNSVSTNGINIPYQDNNNTFARESFNDINKNNLLLEGCFLYDGVALVPPLRYSMSNAEAVNPSITYYYNPSDPSKIDIFTADNRSYVIPKNEYLYVEYNNTGYNIYDYLNSYRQSFINNGIYSDTSIYDTSKQELFWSSDGSSINALKVYTENFPRDRTAGWGLPVITYNFSNSGNDLITETTADKSYIKTFTHILQPNQIIVKPKNYYSNVISYSITKL